MASRTLAHNKDELLAAENMIYFRLALFSYANYWYCFKTIFKGEDMMSCSKLEKFLILLIFPIVSSCASFNPLKGGVQVSPDSSALKYELYRNKLAVCVKGDDFNRCHNGNYNIKDTYLRIQERKTNIRLRCEDIAGSKHYKCYSAVQVAGQLGISLSSLDSPLREWGDEKCYFLTEYGAVHSCDSIEPYFAEMEKRKRENIRQAKLLKKELDTKRMSELARHRERCNKEKIDLRNNIAEGQHTLQGLVVEVRDEVVLIQGAKNSKWHKIADVLPVGC